MFDRIFKSLAKKGKKQSDSASKPVLPRIEHPLDLPKPALPDTVQRHAISNPIEFSKCLDDIFAEIIKEQPLFGLRV